MHNEARLRVQALGDHADANEHLVGIGLAGRIIWQQAERLAHAADLRESWGDALRLRALAVGEVEELDEALVLESPRYAPPPPEGRRG